MAGGINGFSGRNSSGVQANFPFEILRQGANPFRRRRSKPEFSGRRNGKTQERHPRRHKKEEDYLPGYTFKLLYRELYKKHPYGMTVSGAPEVVSALKKENLSKHYETIFVPSRMILTIVGDVSADYAVEKIKDAFKGFERKAGPMPELTDRRASARHHIHGRVQRQGANQHRHGVHRADRALERHLRDGSADRDIKRSGRRLFIELRDKKSLAYSLSAFARPGRRTGNVRRVYRNRARQKEAAITGITEELKR